MNIKQTSHIYVLLFVIMITEQATNISEKKQKKQGVIYSNLQFVGQKSYDAIGRLAALFLEKCFAGVKDFVKTRIVEMRTQLSRTFPSMV